MPRKSLATAKQDAADELQDNPAAQPHQTDTETAGESANLPSEQAGDEENQALSQTDMESPEFPAGQHDQDQNAPFSQTDTEPGADEGRSASAECPDDAVPQTGIEPGDEGIVSESEDALQPDTEPDYQTGMESSDESHGSLIHGALQPDTGPNVQTGLESDTGMAEIINPVEDQPDDLHTGVESVVQEAKKPRRRVAKPQSGESENTPAQTEINPTRLARRKKSNPDPVLAIDDERTVETSADKLRNDLLDLVESHKGRKILSGAIQGVERSADNPNLSFAVIYHGSFKVIIPAEETVRPPEDFRDRSPADVMHYLVTKRLGAEVDFIVKGVDPASGIAAASRLEAMALKRRQYYFGTDRDGNNLIYEGLSAEARVVSVIRAGMFVDLFGLETYIPLRELSYQRWIDAAAHFQPGQRVLVKILKLDRSDRDDIRVSASVKQAGENPYEMALKRYKPGSRYVGTVSMVDTTGVFVSLDGGVDCLCSYPKRGRPPRGARVTVRVIGVNNDNNRIWGAITHMATAR